MTLGQIQKSIRYYLFIPERGISIRVPAALWF